ncbi:Clp protease [Devosia pacifica]|uniref:Clp protease n=1 Tax=Devosia pacifica TaxID=1335967 RepID=A0A918VT90_9HYPH|nr:signal peptide peptidase SppA [Devosia pacifica]GHA21093.1 Clp protease [Devosia pacifica]
MSDDIRYDSAHTVLAADRYRRSRGLWRLLAFAALAIAVLAIAGRFALIDAPGPGDRIARIEINGPIATSQARFEAIEDLMDDEAVRAVIVSINSPGGTTAGGEEIYEALLRLQEVKPVVSVINELGASAAYMSAIGTERIYARRLSIVGSIGVLYQHVDAGKLLDTIGIDFDKIASGPLKAEPDIDEPLVGAPRDSLARLVNDSFEWFVDIVAERRGFERSRALELSDGRVVTGRMAEAAGLIDALGGEREAQLWLEEQREVDADLPIVTAYPKPQEGFGWFSDMVVREARSAIGISPDGPVVLDGLVSLWQVEQR